MDSKELQQLMRVIITTMILCFPLITFGQINFENPPWSIGCDTMDTQLEMNVCSDESFTIADSLLTQEYRKLILHLDRIYNAEKKKSLSSNDKILLDHLLELKKLKESVVTSQKDFIKLRDSMTDIINYQYSGGSMRPLAVNSFALELTINQLKLLTSIRAEMMD
jgi:uncharacterized protein YecT (DUF1311 family)